MNLSKTLLSCLAAAAIVPAAMLQAQDQRLFVGTYTNAKQARVPSQGIYTFLFDSQTGKLSQSQLAAEIESPSFLSISQDLKHLYAVSELAEGSISAFNLDAPKGKLQLINTQSTEGMHPCYVSMAPNKPVVLVANYSTGNVISYPLREDGGLGDFASNVKHTGESKVNERRQQKPHAHSFVFDPTLKRAFAADLGCDKVFAYQVDEKTAELTAQVDANLTLPPGSGPRHVAFHPSGKWVYSNGEMTMTVSSFTYDVATGKSQPLETVSTLPAGTEITNKLSTAEILVHPNGKFLYVSNRGDHSLALFSIDAASGKLTFVETVSSVVKTPRNFRLDETGKWLIAAGQESSNLAVFAVDPNTGKLQATGDVYDVGSPVCLKFVTLP